MKRTLTGMAAVALLLTTLAPAALADTQAVNYTDINGNFAQQQIVDLTAKGFIHGYSDGTYRPGALVSRGQFLAYFMHVVEGTTGVRPGAHQQYYKDIPARNWDYNYIGAAYEAGWINQYWIGVKPGGLFNENYQASWGDAASFYVAAMEKAQGLKLPTGVSPLAYAKSIGLFNGIPTDQNQMYLNRASAAVVLENIYTKVTQGQVPAGATVTINGNATMAVNTNQQLSVVMKDANGAVFNYGNAAITYQSDNANDAFVSPSGNLVVTQPGTYHITATVDGITSAPFTVTVAGTAVNVKLSAATSSLVADGSATDVLTAQVVDVNGNVVSNFNGSLEFKDSTGQLLAAGATNVSGDVTSVPVVNGVATITMRANGTPGTTDTITATNVVATGSATALQVNGTAASSSVTVAQTPQQATSLKVVPASATVENNVPTKDGFTVLVLDQAGQPMLTGVYDVNLSVSGVGQLDSGTPATTAYVGNGSATTAGVQGNIWSEQGQTGSIVITASSPNLQSGSATIASTVVGAPAALQASVDAASSATFGAGSSGLFDLTTVDASGHVVTDTANPSYAATVWQGATQITSGVTAAVVGGKVQVSGTVAGSYTLKVTSSDNLAPATVNFTITAGTPTSVQFTSSSLIDLPINGNTTSIMAQLEDAYGNNVSTSGIPAEFTVTTKAGSDAGSINGSAGSAVTLYSTASGQYVIPFTGSHVQNDQWALSVDKVNNVSIASASQPQVTLKMVSLVPTAIKLGLQDTVSAPGNNATVYLHSQQYAQAGDTVTFTLSATDPYGNPSTNGDMLQVTLPAGFVNPTNLSATATQGVYDVQLPSSGTLTFTATASQAGTATVQVQDLSVASTNVAGSASMTIVPGVAVGAALFNGTQEVTAQNLLPVTANTPVELWLKPVDSQGNVVTEGAATTFTLVDQAYVSGNWVAANGQFRASETGAQISTVALPAGSGGTAVWYVNGNTGNYYLSAK